MKTLLLGAALLAALPARGAPDPLTDPRRDIVGAELDLLPVAISAADGRLYLNPWAAGHVLLGNPEIELSGERFRPRRIQAEASLKIGWAYAL